MLSKFEYSGLASSQDEVDRKHESIEARLGQTKADDTKLTIITSRRLASWLLSDWLQNKK